MLCVKQMHFPEQPIYWEYLLDKFVKPSDVCFPFTFTERMLPGVPFQERMRYLVMCGLSTRVEGLPFKVWRDHITKMIQTSNFKYNGGNSLILLRIQEKLAHFEDELPILKEVTTILELALWKMKMNEKSHQDSSAQSHKRIKTDESITRQQCRVTCCADVIIGPVLKFLIATGDEIYDYDNEIEEDLDGEENLDGDEVRDSDIN
jgi:hypothetical protein